MQHHNAARGCGDPGGPLGARGRAGPLLLVLGGPLGGDGRPLAALARASGGGLHPPPQRGVAPPLAGRRRAERERER